MNSWMAKIRYSRTLWCISVRTNQPNQWKTCGAISTIWHSIAWPRTISMKCISGAILSLYYGFNEIDPDHVAAQVWDSADQRVDEALASGFDVINSTSNSLYLIPAMPTACIMAMSTCPHSMRHGMVSPILTPTGRATRAISPTAIIIAHMICYWAIRRSWRDLLQRERPFLGQ